MNRRYCEALHFIVLCAAWPWTPHDFYTNIWNTFQLWFIFLCTTVTKNKIIINNYKFATKLKFFIYFLKNSAASFFLFFIIQASQSRKQQGWNWIFRLHFKIDSKLFLSASGQQENREKNIYIVRHEPESASIENHFFVVWEPKLF